MRSDFVLKSTVWKGGKGNFTVVMLVTNIPQPGDQD